MDGAEIEAKLTPHIVAGKLSLAAPNGLGSAPIETLLSDFFGGLLSATLGTATVGASSVAYTGSAVATAGFALYSGEPELPASICFSTDGNGTIQLEVALTLPTGFELAQSFPVLSGSRSPLAAVSFTAASYRLDSTLAAESAEFAATVDTTQGVLAPLSWLFAAPPQVAGEIAIVGLDTAKANFTGRLETSTLASSPGISGFSLTSGLRLLSAALPGNSAGTTIMQTVEAIADLEAGELKLPLSIVPSFGATRFAVRLDLLRPQPQLSRLAQLSELAGGENPASLLSSDTPIGELSLDWLSFTLDTGAKQICDIQVAVGLGESWPVVEDLITLDGLTAILTVPNPLEISKQPPSLLVTAVFELGSGAIDAYVQYPQKVVGLSLTGGKAIDIDDFLGKLAAGTKLPGDGDLSIVALDAIADIGQSSYSLSAQAAGQLAIIAGFELDEISLNVEYAKGALQGFGFGCLFAIAGVELGLVAAYAAGNWQLEGGTFQQAQIDLTALTTDLAKIAALPLPGSLPKVELSNLRLAYKTADGSFEFEKASLEFEAAVSVFTEDPLFEEVEAQVSVTHSTIDGTPSWTGTVSGTLAIGNSTLKLEYDFTADQTVSLSWQVSGSESFDVAPLIAQLSGEAPAIPQALDLGLKSLTASYDVTKETLLLGAASDRYGAAALWSEPLATGGRLYAFGVEVPLGVTLADIPLVGDKIPDADQLGIAAIGSWFLSSALTKPQVEAVNAKVAALGMEFPQLPDAEAGETAILTGALQLGSDSVPLAVPIGGQPQPGPLPSARPSTAQPTGTAPASDGTRWFNVQRSFGVFYINRLGVAYESGANTLSVALDASIQLGPLSFSTQGLAVSSPLTTFDPTFTMSGLGVSYSQPPLQIAGSFLAIPKNQLAPNTAFQYDGVAVVKAAQFSLAAIGSYAQETSGDPSLFVFAQLEAPLGGPPEFFVTGLMAGFGYNRSLELPNQNEVMGFPLLVLGAPAAPGKPAAQQDPAHVLAVLEGRAPISPGGEQKEWIAPRTGSYWIAVGLEATSYELVDTKALLIAEFGEQLAFALLGISTLRFPQGAPNAETYAYVELALELVLEPEQGVFAMAAVLTPNSYLIAPACHLTGGFAFCIWFGDNPHAGQFVITLGGYHPAFSPPSYFPAEPRLGFNWAVSSEISVKGGAYLALTSSCVMAGGGLEVTFSSGDLQASCTAQADVLVSWHPFFFRAEIGVSIHVSYKLSLGFCTKHLSVSAAASVSLTGPPTGGKVKVHLWFISFTVEFGAALGEAADEPLDWAGFSALLPAAHDICKLTASEGVTAMPDDPNVEGAKLWIVRAASFSFATETAIPATELAYGGPKGTPTSTKWPLAIRAMNLASASSTHTVTIERLADGTSLDLSQWQPETRTRAVPESLWGAPLKDGKGRFTQVPQRASASTLAGAPIGAQLQAPAAQLGAEMGPIAAAKLYEPVAAPGAAAVDAQAPLATAVAPSGDFALGFDPTSLAQVAAIAEGTAKRARDGICAALTSSGIYAGPNEAMTKLAADADELFADAPLTVTP